MGAPEQIRRLFDEAVELPAPARAAYLDRACRDDPELRRELQSLLEAADQARTGELLPPLGLSSDEYAGPALIGKRVHNYEIVSALGEGGMGTVYLARHQYFPRQAAIKVLHAHLGTDRTVEQRFLNEARAAAAIKHPNIIDIQDAGLLESGAPYLLMEYLVGDNLRTRLDRDGKLPLDQALQIVGQVSSALAAAHAAGIVHRDLKPENLFITRRSDGKPRVKVLDFGIAKLRDDVSGQDVRTRTGVVMGTPRYMSPEQCRGGRDVDHRTDIYSLGVILYEMLCGRPPFVSEGVVDVIYMQIAQAPAPPTRLNPEIPAAVEDAILKALAKQPEQRFASVREFRAALGPAAVPLAEPRVTVAATDDSGTLPAAAGDPGDDLDVPAGTGGRWSRWAVLLLSAAVVVALGMYGLRRQGAQRPTEAAGVRAPAPTPPPPPAPDPVRPAVLPVAADAAAEPAAVPAPVVNRDRRRARKPPDGGSNPERW